MFSESGLLSVTDRASNVTYPVRTDGYTVRTDRTPCPCRIRMPPS